MSMPIPICSDNGGYMVHPVPDAPPPTKNEATSSKPAGGSSQNEKLFIRERAMSEAPICKGTIQFASMIMGEIGWRGDGAHESSGWFESQ